MKRFILFILFPLCLNGQELTIQQCFEMAQNNHPLSPKSGSVEEIYNLKKANLKTKWYPELNVNAQATYQEPVLQFDMNTEGLPFQLDFPTPSNDQYKTWLDIKQNVYDGGIIKKSVQIEQQNAFTEQINNEITIEKTKQVVAQLFFNILVLDQQIKQAELTNNELNERLKNIESLVNRGVVLQSNYDGVKGENLKLQQQIISLKNKKFGLEAVLKKYLGLESPDSVSLKVPEFEDYNKGEINRTEYELFEANAQKINLYQDLTRFQKRPKIYGFSQVGYGNPGLNMLNDSFEPYFIVGGGLSWNIYDWKKSKRDIQVLQVQKEDIELNRNNFNLELKTNMDKVMADIETYKELLITDQEIINTYSNITKLAVSQFENGTMGSTEYLSELNKEKQAILAYEIHKIQYRQAILSLMLLTGEL